MSLESGLVSLLTADSGVSALVGSRVYPDKLPDSPTLPALTYQVASLTPRYAHSGDADLDTVRVQVNCWAVTRTTAVTVRDAVRTAVSGYRGTTGDGTVFDRVSIENQNYEIDTSLNQYAVITDLLITHRRT